MRRSEKTIFKFNGKKLLALTMTADACSEHEGSMVSFKRMVGIPALKEVRGMPVEEVTFEKFYKFTQVGDKNFRAGTFVQETSPRTSQAWDFILMREFDFSYNLTDLKLGMLLHEAKGCSTANLVSAWSNRGFFVAAKANTDEASFLKVLSQALQDNSALFCGEVVDSPCGLTIALPDAFDRVQRSRVREMTQRLKAEAQPVAAG